MGCNTSRDLPVLSEESNSVLNADCRVIKTQGLNRTVPESWKGEERDCPICLETISDPERLICGHCFCKKHLLGYQLSRCPICRHPVKPSIGGPVSTNTEKSDRGASNSDGLVATESNSHESLQSDFFYGPTFATRRIK